MAEHHACRALGENRSARRKLLCRRPGEARQNEDIAELARSHGRYGYRMVAGMPNNAGWHMNNKRVEHI